MDHRLALCVSITFAVIYWLVSSPESTTLPWWQPPASSRVVSLLYRTNTDVAVNMAVATAVSVTTPTLTSRRFQEEVVSKYPDDLVWYCRSNDGFDYFHLQPGPLVRAKCDHDYRVSSRNAPLTARQTFSTNSSTWMSWAQAAGLTH